MNTTEILDLLNNSDCVYVEYECDDYIWYMCNVETEGIIIINEFEFEYSNPMMTPSIVIHKDYNTLSLGDTEILGMGVRKVEFFIDSINNLEIR